MRDDREFYFEIMSGEKYVAQVTDHENSDARLIALAPDFARLCAELGEALQASMPERCQALAPSSPNYRDGKECGRCTFCRARAVLAKLAELEAR